MSCGNGTAVPEGRLAPGGVEVAACALGVSVGRGVGEAASVDVTIASFVGRATGPVSPQAVRASGSRAIIHFLRNDVCFGMNILMGWLGYLMEALFTCEA